MKSLGNTDQNGARKNVKDIVIFGEDLFKLLSKASSKEEGWMKSTKAMEVPGGCVVQVTTQQGDNVAEAVCFVPGVKIEGDVNPTINVVEMTYGYQIEVKVKCSTCGKPYKEIQGKGSMVSDIGSVVKVPVVEKVEQVTSSKPTIAKPEEVGEPLSFGERMKIAKAKKKEEMKKEEMKKAE